MDLQWRIAPDGSFGLSCGKLQFTGCYPAIGGQSIRPVRVSVAASSVRYTLAEGEILLTFGQRGDALTLDCEIHHMQRLPWRIAPVAGQVMGAQRLYRLGLGFSGPSGWVPLEAAGDLFSQESYLATAFSQEAVTLAFGALDHRDYLQKTIITNRQSRRGLTNRQVDLATIQIEAAFFTEGVAGSEVMRLPQIVFHANADSHRALQATAAEIASAMWCRTQQPARYHWCSWYEKGCNFGMEDLTQMLAGMGRIENPPRFQAIQIDDGYCPHAGDWLTPSNLWPGGLQEAFGAIRSAGYSAGVWVAPFMVGSLSQLFREHPDWIIRDQAGRPVVEWKKYDASGIPSHIDPEHYALDASHPGVQKYVREVFRTLRSWGATYYKTDFMDWGLRDSASFRRHNPAETSVQSFRKILQIIREEIGEESFWLGCISPYAPFLGYADGMRIANDVGPGWGDGSQGNMIQESIATQFFNNIFWRNDPDVILLRDYHNELSELEVRSLALFEGFLGSIVNFSDMPHKLPADRLELMRLLEPPAHFPAAAVPLWDQSRKVRLLARSYANGGRALLVMNPTREPQIELLPLKEVLGVAEAHVWDWELGRESTCLGRVADLVVKLREHETKLYWTSPDGLGPPKYLTKP